jgi:hypothetical protein
MVIYLICDLFIDHKANSRSTLREFTVKKNPVSSCDLYRQSVYWPFLICYKARWMDVKLQFEYLRHIYTYLHHIYTYLRHIYTILSHIYTYLSHIYAYF